MKYDENVSHEKPYNGYESFDIPFSANKEIT